jgi:hypothetical protein
MDTARASSAFAGQSARRCACCTPGTRDKPANLFVSLGYFSKRLSRCCPGRDNTRGWNEIAARSMNIGIDIWMMPTVVIPA